jgi:hypothetical protein
MKTHQIVLCILLPCLVSAQPDTLWTRTYGTTWHEEATDVRQAADGGYFIGGFTGNIQLQVEGWSLVRTDGVGDTLWTRTFVDSDYVSCTAVCPLPDSGAIFVGYGFRPDSGDFGRILRLDAAGNLLWEHSLTAHSNVVSDIEMATDSTFAVCGRATGSTEFDEDCWLAEINLQGDIVWSRTYPDSSLEHAVDLALTVDGGFILTGYILDSNTSYDDAFAIKTTPDGTLQWRTVIGGDDIMDQRGYGVTQTTDGDYVVCGSTETPGDPWFDGLLVRLDVGGNIVWQTTQGGSLWDELDAILPMPDGGVMAAGWTSSFSDVNHGQFWLTKTSAEGSMEWQWHLIGLSPDYCYAVISTSDSGYAMVGQTGFWNPQDSDYWLVKLSHASAPVWSSPSTRPARYALTQNYPNPFNSATRIPLELPHSGHVLLEVFDLVGRKVATVAEGNFSAGPHTFLFDAGDLPSGMYVYHLTADSEKLCRRMIILK